MKKRVFILFLLVTAMQYCFAQDVIITRNEERIEAKVEEISDTEVRYHRQDNLNGPVFVMSTSHIAAIVFANGEVKLFDKQMENKQQPSQDIQSGNNLVGETLYSPGKLMERKYSSYYYGGELISEYKYETILKDACPKAYASLMSSEAMEICEWLFFGISFTLLDVSLFAMSINLDYGAEYAENAGKPWLIWSMVSAGAGVGFMIGKYNLRKKSVTEFNEHCAMQAYSQADVTLQFGIAPTGVGLTLNF